MKIRVIKKMMAYLLVGAMVLSTPMTASATEPSIADVYTDTDDGDGSGTLSGSNTNTGVLDTELNKPEVQAQVIGLALDKTSLSLEKNGAVDKDRLQARVLFTDYSPENEEMVLAANEETKKIVDQFLRWRVIDNEGDTVNNVVGLSYYEKADGSKDYSMVNVNAKHGGTVQVQAYIDYDNNKKLDAGEFHAEATVSVKEFAEDFEWNVPEDEKFFMNWEYDLNDYIKLNPETASDDVSFYAKTNAKKVTISDSGIMKVKKVSEGETVEVVATIENGVSHEAILKLDPGTPAKKVAFLDKNVILDHGRKTEQEKTLKVELKPVTDGKTVTDLVKWTAKPDVVNFDITEYNREKNTAEVKITIKGDAVGKVKITAQATSGKKATTTVVINSTPANIKVEPVVTWTGKKPKVEVVPLGDDGEKIPVNKNGYKFEVTSVNETENIKNIKVNKTSGAITIPTVLTNKGTGKDKAVVKQDVANVKVSLTKANGKKFTSSVVTGDNTITAKQANIKDINVWNTTYANKDSLGTQVLANGSTNNKATEPVGKYKITVGSKYQYQVNATSGWTDTVDPELSDAVAWTSSSAKVGTVSDGGLFTALKGGTTKIKLSYVTITDEKKCKAKLNSKTITIKPIQKATSLTLNKNTFVVVAERNPKDISISVKKQLPKGSKDLITWKQVVGELGEDGKTIVNAKHTMLEMKKYTNSKTTTVKVPVKEYKAGTVVKIGAYADGGAVAYAYIYVVADKAKAVRAMEGEKATTDSSAKKLTKLELAVGNSKTITPQIQKTSDKTFIQATVYSKENIAYSTDPVTYSFSKAGIASINSQTGKITAMKPGTTKLTIKTLSGKKATVTIKVK